MMKFVQNILLAAALMLVLGGAVAHAQNFPSFTIRQIQEPPLDSLLANNDDSPMLGDTVTTVGVVIVPNGDFFVGNRLAVYIQDENGGPYSGLMVIQHDPAAPTGFDGVLVGDKIEVTGVVAEFQNQGGNPSSSTQLEVLTNPVVPVKILAAGVPMPPAQVITADSLSDFVKGEKWESQFIRMNDLVVVSTGLASNQMSAQDATGLTVLDDHFNNMFNYFSGGGSWPVPGTLFDVYGFIRGYSTVSTIFTVNPPHIDSVFVKSNPPVVQDLARGTGIPTSADNVDVTATAFVGGGGTIQEVVLHYSVDNNAFMQLPMTDTDGDSVYSATIPAQSDGAFVKYFIEAKSTAGETSIVPADTSRGMPFYVVHDGAITIKDVQWTPFADGNSSLAGYEVTVQGIVMNDTTQFPGAYFLQTSAAPWEGIYVRDNDNKPQPGDMVEITASVQENFGLTRLRNVSAFSVLSSGNTVPDPVVVNTGDIGTGGSMAEAYEGVLVRVENLVVSNPFPDGSRNFGEFVVDDGSGGVRVDDAAAMFEGNQDSTFAQGDSIAAVVGHHYYTFGNFKIEPRSDADIIGHKTTTGILATEGIPSRFDLAQNYPNPFNPETKIRYSLEKASKVSLVIYNALGQEVRTLVNERQGEGVYLYTWDGRNNAGVVMPSGIYFTKLVSDERVKVRKMILLR